MAELKTVIGDPPEDFVSSFKEGEVPGRKDVPYPDGVFPGNAVNHPKSAGTNAEIAAYTSSLDTPEPSVEDEAVRAASEIVGAPEALTDEEREGIEDDMADEALDETGIKEQASNSPVARNQEVSPATVEALKASRYNSQVEALIKEAANNGITHEQLTGGLRQFIEGVKSDVNNGRVRSSSSGEASTNEDFLGNLDVFSKDIADPNITTPQFHDLLRRIPNADGLRFAFNTVLTNDTTAQAFKDALGLEREDRLKPKPEQQGSYDFLFDDASIDADTGPLDTRRAATLPSQEELEAQRLIQERTRADAEDAANKRQHRPEMN